MKLLFDPNLSPRLVQHLSDLCRSEALECVQLAAAFPLASSLAGVSITSRTPQCGLNLFVTSESPSQQAGWGESGSKLHALQSFAPHGMSGAADLAAV